MWFGHQHVEEVGALLDSITGTGVKIEGAVGVLLDSVTVTGERTEDAAGALLDSVTVTEVEIADGGVLVRKIGEWQLLAL